MCGDNETDYWEVTWSNRMAVVVECKVTTFDF